MERLAREFTPRATEILRDIATDPSEDSRNRIVAIGMLYDRAWGRPKEYDPAEDKAATRPRFDPSLYTPEQPLADRGDVEDDRGGASRGR
jgi:hypothetical protein